MENYILYSRFMSVTLVAGGATGIGRAVVHALRARGDSVMLADLAIDAAEELVADDLPGPAEAIGCDLADPVAARIIVEQTLARFGRLDTVVVAAGLLLARPLDGWTVEDWDRSMAVNLRAPFLLAQAAAPALEQTSGSLVFVSSTGALRGHAGMPAYHASKAGLDNLVRALADELSPRGVRVNAVRPGWIDTPFNKSFWEHQDDPAAALDDLLRRIPSRRQGQPEDVVGPILFLASPQAAYITGECLVVDGGYSAV